MQGPFMLKKSIHTAWKVSRNCGIILLFTRHKSVHLSLAIICNYMTIWLRLSLWYPIIHYSKYTNQHLNAIVELYFITYISSSHTDKETSPRPYPELLLLTGYCATSLNAPGSIPGGVFDIFHRLNPTGRATALGLRQPLTEMSTRIFPGGKDGRCEGMTTLPVSCADCLEILEASTSWSPGGLYRDCCTCYCCHSRSSGSESPITTRSTKAVIWKFAVTLPT